MATPNRPSEGSSGISRLSIAALLLSLGAAAVTAYTSSKPTISQICTPEGALDHFMKRTNISPEEANELTKIAEVRRAVIKKFRLAETERLEVMKIANQTDLEIKSPAQLQSDYTGVEGFLCVETRRAEILWPAVLEGKNEEDEKRFMARNNKLGVKLNEAEIDKTVLCMENNPTDPVSANIVVLGFDKDGKLVGFAK